MRTSKESRFTAFAMGCILFAGLAQASPITFDFQSGGTNSGSGFGNFRTFTSGGVTVTITAWGLTGNSNTTFQTGQLGQSIGLGLADCNQNEGLDCDSPNHHISNENGIDFVLLQFSAPVSIGSVTLVPVGVFDTDTTYYLGNHAAGLDLTGASLAGLAALGFGSATNNDSVASDQPRTFTIGSGSVNSFLIGARVNGDANLDFFKLAGLTADTVPEPSTLGLAGAALVALGLLRRKR